MDPPVGLPVGQGSWSKFDEEDPFWLSVHENYVRVKTIAEVCTYTMDIRNCETFVIGWL